MNRQSDEWRGEHFIRAPKRQPEEFHPGFKPTEFAGAPVHGQVCRVPGCGRGLNAYTKAGCCKQHNHNRDWCLCLQCEAKRQKRRQQS